MPTDIPSCQLTHADHKPAEKRLPVCLLADNLQDPLNVGSLFRLADAFAIKRMYLTGTSPTPPDRKIRKTSRSTEQSVDFISDSSPISIIEQLKKQRYWIISLELSQQSIDIKKLVVPSDRPLCLIVGAENTGVSETLLSASDICVHIPMRGDNSSMNVANATAIALYELSRQLKPHA